MRVYATAWEGEPRLDAEPMVRHGETLVILPMVGIEMADKEYYAASVMYPGRLSPSRVPSKPPHTVRTIMVS